MNVGVTLSPYSCYMSHCQHAHVRSHAVTMLLLNITLSHALVRCHAVTMLLLGVTLSPCSC